MKQDLTISIDDGHLLSYWAANSPLYQTYLGSVIADTQSFGFLIYCMVGHFVDTLWHFIQSKYDASSSHLLLALFWKFLILTYN